MINNRLIDYFNNRIENRLVIVIGEILLIDIRCSDQDVKYLRRIKDYQFFFK